MARWFCSHILASLLTLSLVLTGCGSSTTRYTKVEQYLQASQPAQADRVMEEAEKTYSDKDRLLYWMDRGMTLHLAGRYQESNDLLERADQEIERLYTRQLRTEAKAMLTYDTAFPFEGSPFEQVMVNVVKALNYAAMGNWTEALVEARRIDHRLNVLSDQVRKKDAYRDDAFARYLSGLLYEVAGELNDAFISYRNAYEAYRRGAGWIGVPVPRSLQADLLRTTDALHLQEEHAEYQKAFPDVAWQPVSETKGLAQILIVSYDGRAPKKVDQFLDLPISLDALELVLLTRGIVGPGTQDTRAADSLLYGLTGHVVRVALPRLVPQKTQVAYLHVRADGSNGVYNADSIKADNLTAVAEKTLKDQYPIIVTRAVARAAIQLGLAEGTVLGAQAALGNNSGPWIFLLGRLGTMIQVYLQEADKRSWRTLPDEIQVARVQVPPGSYRVNVRPVGGGGNLPLPEFTHTVTLHPGETRLFIERIVE